MSDPGTSDPAERISAKDKAALTLDAWKKAVDVQQHFNDLELRVRNLAMTLLGAAIGALGVASVAGGAGGSGQQVGTVGAVAPLRVPLLIGVLALVWAFYIMDRWWYHRLLNGAVAEGGRLEESLTEQGIKVELGRAISRASPIKVLGYTIPSDNKIDFFYLILASVVLGGLTGLMAQGWFIPTLLLVGLWALWVGAVVRSPRNRKARSTPS